MQNIDISDSEKENRLEFFLKITFASSMFFMIFSIFSYSFYICSVIPFDRNNISLGLKLIYSFFGLINFIIPWLILFVIISLPFLIFAQNKKWLSSFIYVVMIFCEFPAALIYKIYWSYL